jgi:trk system potassium uptake protein TrkH
MNIRFVIGQLGMVLLVLSVCMLMMTGGDMWSLASGGESSIERPAIMALFITIIIGGVLALIAWTIGRTSTMTLMGRREALLLVALSWLVGAAVSGLPYYLWWKLLGSDADHAFASAISCYFEAMSGLTTTGATVLKDVTSIPNSLLLWRAMTHWLGGVGIVVLFVAVLPSLGVGGKRLFQIEAPGPQQQGVRPRIRQTARMLWLIYLLLTAVQIVALKLCNMSWLDSLCHTFATLATGGFSTRNSSVGGYNSTAIDLIMILFMVLAGVNFGLYYQLARRRFKAVWRDPELRIYLGILLAATIIIVFCIVGKPLTTTYGQTITASTTDALRYGAFQVVAIQTGTGFATANFDLWGFVPKAVLVMLMFIGASAGSTGGGIKVIRILVVFKVIFAEIERVFRPHVVRTIRVGQGVVSPEMRQSVLVYVLGIIILFVLGAVGLMIFEPTGELSFITAATASAASLNNIGPGLAAVGAMENYGFFSGPSKLLLSLLMVLGRLEVYAILILLVPTPSFWRGD